MTHSLTHTRVTCHFRVDRLQRQLLACNQQRHGSKLQRKRQSRVARTSSVPARRRVCENCTNGKPQMKTEQISRNQGESHRRDAETQRTQRSSRGAHASSAPGASDTGTQDACAPRSRGGKSLARIFLCPPEATSAFSASLR